MTLQDYTLDYSRYGPKVLRNFVMARLRLSGREYENAPKKDLARRLRRLDRDMNFRFMDLLPELRAHVYEYLFTDSGVFSQILAVSKQLQREARPFMEAVHQVTWHVKRRSVFLTAYRTKTQLGHAASEVVDALFRHRELFRSIHKLTIALEPGPEGFIRQHVVHPAVFNFCAFLAFECSGSRLREVEIRYRKHASRLREQVALDGLRQLLWPVCLLCGRFAVNVSGLGEQTEELRSAVMREAQPQMLEACERYMHAAHQIADLVQDCAARLAREEACEYFDGARRLEEIHNRANPVAVIGETTEALEFEYRARSSRASKAGS